MSSRLIVACVAALMVCGAATAAPARMTDAQVKQAVIAESIASYPGNCPCPYNADRRGHSCGRRSAYSRVGGYGPKCYAQDVTPADVASYRARHAG